MDKKALFVVLFLNAFWTCQAQYYSINLTSNNQIYIGSSGAKPVLLQNWVAKAYWNINNYNKTGYKSILKDFVFIIIYFFNAN